MSKKKDKDNWFGEIVDNFTREVFSEDRSIEKIAAYKKKYQIISIHKKYIHDPILANAFKLAFDWANRQGLAGIRCTDLEFKLNDKKDPLNIITEITCEMSETKKS